MLLLLRGRLQAASSTCRGYDAARGERWRFLQTLAQAVLDAEMTAVAARGAAGRASMAIRSWDG